MNDYVQAWFGFALGGATERIERDVAYASRHPDLEAAMVEIMRDLARQGLMPSIHSAIVRLREQGVPVFDGAKAFYGRLIASKYADLRLYIKTAPSELDS